MAKVKEPRKTTVCGEDELRYLKGCGQWMNMIGVFGPRYRAVLSKLRIAYTEGSDADRHRVRVELYATHGMVADDLLDHLNDDLELFAALPNPERAAGIRDYAKQFARKSA